MTRGRRWHWAVLAAGVLLAGCSTYGTIRQAQDRLGAAEAAGAEQRAPYHYTAARLYLDAATHEHTEWDWKAAADWAQKSLDHAEQAVTEAKGGAQ